MIERIRVIRRTASSPDVQFHSIARAPRIDPIVEDGGTGRKYPRAQPTSRATGREQPSNRATTPPRLLTIIEGAEVLNTSDKTVRREIKKGELRAIRIGNQWRIDPCDLEDYIRDRRTR